MHAVPTSGAYVGREFVLYWLFFFFFQAEDGIRDLTVTGVQTCALPISLDDLELRLVRLGTVEGRPLEGRPGLRDEGRDRQRQAAERLPRRIEHAQALEHPLGEQRDRLHVRERLCRLADHEVGLEVRDPVGADEVARGQDLLVGDRLADGPAQTLRARLRGYGQGAVAAAGERGDKAVREAVGPDGRDRELEPVVLDDLQQLADPRVVRDARADEPHTLLAARGHAGHGLAEGVDAPVPHRTVDLTLQTEPAATATPPTDFQQRQ